MAHIGIGIVGGGYMGKAHAVAMSAVAAVFDTALRPRLEVICTTTPEGAAEKARQFGFARATADWRQLVADPKVEAVVIASTQDTAAAPEAVLTDAFLTGFKQSLQDSQTLKIYDEHLVSIREIVNVNFSIPVISKNAEIVAERMSSAESKETARFFNSKTGKKFLRAVKNKDHPVIADVISKTELKEIERFLKTSTGVKWNKVMPEISSKMNETQVSPSEATKQKLSEFFKAQGQ